MGIDEVERAMESTLDDITMAAKPAESKDPWVHRVDNMLCKTCMYFVPKQVAPAKLGTIEIGRCRRHAPTMSGYPVVFLTDWCGDHKLDENRA